MSECKTISVNDYIKLCDQHKNIKIVDIRSADEYNREHIKGADNKTPEELKEGLFNCDDIVVFHCQSGNRTHQAKARFESLGLKNAFILDGGLSAWKKANLPTEVNQKAPLPIARQVQIIVGFMVVVGVILALTISPYFSLISAFFGAGLLFAGLTGTCGLATLLMYLPYNKPPKK